ncbi:MAG: serine/threonine-protein kinase [Myxococcota bacterium]
MTGEVVRPDGSGTAFRVGGTPTPTSIGRYALSVEIASGGMATIYLACAVGPRGFEKVVALKRIHHHLAREKRYIDMFLDEARIASRIVHPNVCGVLDFGEADGEYFLVMDYLVGETLSQLFSKVSRRDQLRTTAAWSRTVTRIVADSCEGLHAAHELKDEDGARLGVVHRDVSPNNLIVGYDGVVRVVDFGIAKAADRLHQTEAGQMKGKFAYMAPEQARNGHVDHRADVWALGVVLWEALTLRRLFRKSNEADTLYAVLDGPIPEVTEFNPHVPKEVSAAIQGALERDPARRHPDARTFARELRSALRASGPVPDIGTVSELMADLFPEGEAAKRALIRGAREGGRMAPLAPEGPLELPAVDSQSPTRPPGRRIVLALVALVGCLTVGLVVALVVIFSRPTPEPDRASLPTPPSIAVPPRPAPPPAPPQGGSGATPPELEGSADTLLNEGPDVGRGSPDPAPEGERLEGERLEGEPVEDERPPEERRARRPRDPGTLVVVVPGGWANVYDANGRLLGETPLRVSLPAGEHDLSLRMFGQPPARRVRAEVRPGETTRVTRRAPR